MSDQDDLTPEETEHLRTALAGDAMQSIDEAMHNKDAVAVYASMKAYLEFLDFRAKRQPEFGKGVAQMKALAGPIVTTLVAHLIEGFELAQKTGQQTIEVVVAQKHKQGDKWQKNSN